MRATNNKIPGHRFLGDIVRKTDKAILFEYHGREVWIPKHAVGKLRKGPYTAPLWAIDSSKDFSAQRRIANEFDPIDLDHADV